MKILACHNYYQQPGGEDQCFEIETELLESEGHDVVRYTKHNDDIKQMSQLQVARKTIWNRQSYAEIRDIVQRERPDVMHCTNTFPLISPAVYYAARREHVPVVQTVQNYRLFCANSQFLRDGKTCEQCLGSATLWPAVYHACYRNSIPASAVVVAMLTYHRLVKTYSKQINVFVAATEFSRSKFVEGGLPAEKIVVNPNFLTINPDPGSGSGGYAAFVGRLAPEKGIDTLLGTWSQLGRPLKLKIAGDGPMADRVQAAAAADDRIEWLGRLNPEQVLKFVSDAACLVLPSIWYEGLPRTIVEAFAVGTPVIASRIGSMIELISSGQNGFHFEPGSVSDLKRVTELFFSDGTDRPRLRRSARESFEHRFTAPASYQNLMKIYAKALGTEEPV